MVSDEIIDEVLKLSDEYSLLSSRMEHEKDFNTRRRYIIANFFNIIYKLSLEQLKYLLENYKLPSHLKAIVQERINELSKSSKNDNKREIQPDDHEMGM